MQTDLSRRRSTVGAGLSVTALFDEMYTRGWCLPNIGVIKSQTVAGLLATCSHGSGVNFQTMVSSVVGECT